MKTYKIQRLSDNKYSTGGSFPSFNKTGKTWSSLKNLKLHLKYIDSCNRFYNTDFDYAGCVIVEFGPVNQYPISEIENIKDDNINR